MLDAKIRRSNIGGAFFITTRGLWQFVARCAGFPTSTIKGGTSSIVEPSRLPVNNP